MTRFHCAHLPSENSRQSILLQRLLIVISSVTLAAGGCMTNLATGERHLNFISEDQEIQMGRESDQQVVASMGLYGDSSVQRYVRQLGTRLESTSERPNLPWSFRVVDDPAVNAFALPGGFIYVTRGILPYLNNEAELAGVMGHEIGHVTAGHSVNQMATQQIAQLGLGIGMALKPELQQFGQLASTGLGLLFLKFSRDDESQADALGLRYMNRQKYNPQEMAGVMTMLDGVTKASGGGNVPEWLETHPDPGNRRERILQEIDTMKSTPHGTVVNGPEYLAKIDGMVFGDNPREGFFRGTLFMQPEMKFQFRFPEGWKTSNTRNAVAAASPQQDAMIQIGMSDQKTAEAAAGKFFSQQGLTGEARRSSSIHSFPVRSAGFTAQTDQGVLQGNASFLEFGGSVFQIVAYSGQQQWAGYQSALMQAVGTFDRLTDPKALAVQPMKLRIVKIDRAMTLQEFNQKYPSSVSIDVVALINQVDPGAMLRAGQSVKQVTGTKAE